MCDGPTNGGTVGTAEREPGGGERRRRNGTRSAGLRDGRLRRCRASDRGRRRAERGRRQRGRRNHRCPGRQTVRRPAGCIAGAAGDHAGAAGAGAAGDPGTGGALRTRGAAGAGPHRTRRRRSADSRLRAARGRGRRSSARRFLAEQPDPLLSAGLTTERRRRPPHLGTAIAQTKVFILIQRLVDPAKTGGCPKPQTRLILTRPPAHAKPRDFATPNALFATCLSAKG